MKNKQQIKPSKTQINQQNKSYVAVKTRMRMPASKQEFNLSVFIARQTCITILV